MKHTYTYRLMIIMLIAVNAAFAVINDGGTDYTEALMPLTQGGTSTYYYVVIGTGLTVSCDGNSEVSTFTINGTNYKGSNNASVSASGDNRYYIIYNGKKSSGSFTISGTNDWTTQTYTSQIAPFSQTGTGSYFYSFTGAIDSIVTSNADFFLINNVNYTNQTLTTMPTKLNDTYYLYYGATSASGSLEVKDYTPKLNVKVFIEGGL